VILNNGDLDEDGIPVFMGRKKIEGYENLRDIHIRGAILNFWGSSILEDSNIHLSWGRRYGLIGKNGCGKSILL
jgi:ABC-type polysaccharide/polyol phosphate transport system ATPase subunit